MVDEALGLMDYELIAYFAVTCGLRPARRLLPLFEPLPAPRPGQISAPVWRNAPARTTASACHVGTVSQWIAAYMIFSSVASVAENSATTLPCRATRMRSDSAIISGR